MTSPLPASANSTENCSQKFALASACASDRLGACAATAGCAPRSAPGSAPGSAPAADSRRFGAVTDAVTKRGCARVCAPSRACAASVAGASPTPISARESPAPRGAAMAVPLPPALAPAPAATAVGTAAVGGLTSSDAPYSASSAISSCRSASEPTGATREKLKLVGTGGTIAISVARSF